MTRKIILDCDPGQDDAVALLVALAAPDALDVLGITAVAGNVPQALTARNARLLRDLADRPDIPVCAGCERPMVRPLVTAESVHGSTGIDGMEAGEPSGPLDPRHGVDFIIESLRGAAEAEVTLVPTGPLTNIAMAIVKAPDILPNIAEIVLMGGAMREGGNFSPSAEFNMLVDPHAADVVFRCSRPITVFGLDVTHQVLATPDRIERIRDLNSRVADAVAGMLGYFNRHDSAKYNSEGAPLHDPCTVAYLLASSLFTFKSCNISVETGSELTMGHTAVDFWHVTDRPANAQWAHGVDAEGFFALLTDYLGRYGGEAR